MDLCKVNVATQFSRPFMFGVCTTLAADPQEVDPCKYLAPARKAMIARVRESSLRKSKCQTRCRFENDRP